jgi:hypothetical protein
VCVKAKPSRQDQLKAWRDSFTWCTFIFSLGIDALYFVLTIPYTLYSFIQLKSKKYR